MSRARQVRRLASFLGLAAESVSRDAAVTLAKATLQMFICRLPRPLTPSSPAGDEGADEEWDACSKEMEESALLSLAARGLDTISAQRRVLHALRRDVALRRYVWRRCGGEGCSARTVAAPWREQEWVDVGRDGRFVRRATIRTVQA